MLERSRSDWLWIVVVATLQLLPGRFERLSLGSQVRHPLLLHGLDSRRFRPTLYRLGQHPSRTDERNRRRRPGRLRVPDKGERKYRREHGGGNSHKK